MQSSKLEFYLSPAELAETLGLSVSTLKRWTDKGILRVERTAGGHRRIALSEALRFVRESGLRPVLPHRLGLGEVQGNMLEDPARQVTDLLLDGRADDARRFLVSAFAGGHDIVTIADQWIRPAFERLGDLWKHSDAGIAIEHQATDAVLRAIVEMRARVEPPQTAPESIGGAIGGDPYALPTALAGLVLAVSGFRSTNLGAYLPRAALFAIVERAHPRLVWLSVSVSDSEEGSRGALEETTAGVLKRGAAVVIGGREAPDRVAGATVCRDMATLSAFGRGLLAGEGEGAGGVP